MASDPHDDELIEETIFDCLPADDPSGELERRVVDWPEKRANRARRALVAVLKQEREIASVVSVPGEPSMIAGYRVLRTLASGGMGVVYLAEQREPVRRRVAIKVIRDEVTTEQVIKRFELERQALALMDHENIAKIFDAQTTEDGRPFLVMEYVQGSSIIEFCDRMRLDIRGRLELFEQVCLAVQHAHHRGIIHRDLKPSNILIAENRERPVPKIIDFGLARPTHGQLIDVTIHTQHGVLVGTPAYMSPEQAEMSSAEIDTRTDIYSLGVVLFELLTGALHLSEETLRGSAAEVQRQVIEGNIPRPSTRVTDGDPRSSDAAGKRQTSIRALTRSLRGDLDWIVLKAMERDRIRRYPTASELAADLRRFLLDEPVSAGPPALGYRLRKLIRRHRGKVVAAAAVAVTMLIGVVFSTLLYVEARTNLEQFNLLRYRVELDDAIAVAEELYPASPELADALHQWLVKRASTLEKARSAVSDTLPKLGEETNSGDRFLRETMQRLQADLTEFFDPESGLAADVRQRYEWASTIHQRSIASHKDRWEAARASLAGGDESLHPGYRGASIDLIPMAGLVPIGVNPTTKLWEFYHLQSAADPERIPEHRKDGSIVIDPDTGIVFVLLPGGRAWIGAQKADPDGPNYDPQVRLENGEGPPRELDIGPFLIARYELTQGQWQRLSGGATPSSFFAGDKARGMKVAATAAHPVESVSYDDSKQLMNRMGLLLPTEPQWVYACRAGSSSPWYTGKELASLIDHANVFDKTCARVYPSWGKPESFDDEYIYHAPVGRFSANPFGLHDVHGNVFEWCRKPTEASIPYARGGAYNASAQFARSAMRLRQRTKSHFVGLRPTCALLESPR